MPFHLKLPPECDEGVIVTVKDVPEEGLTVQASRLLGEVIKECEWKYAAHIDKSVTPDNPIAVFNDLRHAYLIPCDKWCIRVINQDGDVMSVRSEDKPVTIPSTGCASVKMYGYLGCKYRTRITTSPTYPAPGKSFKLKATLVINPYELATEGMEVEFYKLVDGTEEPLGTNTTNESGVAVISHTEPEAGRYKYLARYTGGDTFAEVKTVTVREPICPIEISAIEECPILTATQGTIVFTKLDTLRWFRDNHMPKTLVKMYYWLIPVTGRIAKHSRIARMIIRGLTEMSIKAIERRYNLKWEA